VITWLAIFPLITIVLALFGSLLTQLPLVMRTFVLTVTLVPVMTYLIVPLYMRLFARWLHRSAPESGALAQEVYQGAPRRGLSVHVSIGNGRTSLPCKRG
jgi:antibiotic biosynthesis monooxygenase (ABM) superfamily enzyme